MYFFGDEDLKQTSETQVIITKPSCEDMIGTRSPAGLRVEPDHGMMQAEN